MLRQALPVVACLGAALAAAGVDASPAQKESASRLVLAAVTDPGNRPLIDLGPDDFVINENGEAREVVAVYGADYPIVILVDNGLDSRSDAEAIRSAVSRFLSRVGQRFVALGTLANPPELLTTFDDDRSVLAARLDALPVSATNVLMPIEAVAAAATAIRATGSPFGGVVVVAAHRFDAAQPQNTRLLPDIFESNATVHVVSRTSPAAAPRGRGGAPRLDGDLLRDLAEQTRGYYTTVFSAPSYAVALNNLADRLGSEMIVEYLVPPGSLGQGEVQVGVKVPGARVRGLGVSK